MTHRMNVDQAEVHLENGKIIMDVSEWDPDKEVFRSATVKLTTYHAQQLAIQLVVAVAKIDPGV